MNNRKWIVASVLVCMGLWGCGGGGTAVKVAPPPVKRTTYYYVGAMEVTLKSAPDPESADAGKATLNEQVEMVKRSGSWFLVKTKGGSQGWVSERYMSLRPVSDFYVRRWSRLQSSPSSGSKSVGRLRTNDQVKLVESSGGWAKVTVARSGKTGWMEMSLLSTGRVAVRRYRRSKKGEAKSPSTPEETAPPATETPPAPKTAPGPSLGPKTAEAAAPPAKKKAPPRRKVKPEMFDAF